MVQLAPSSATWSPLRQFTVWYVDRQAFEGALRREVVGSYSDSKVARHKRLESLEMNYGKGVAGYENQFTPTPRHFERVGGAILAGR
jgi:hypothetical protein